jgi:hypothetical protein
MLLSVYTSVRNGLYYDFHIVEMLKHHLPLADEIIVHEGYSTDGTFEAIHHIHPKIRIVRTKWEKPSASYSWYVGHKEVARQQCRGAWCLHLDADEFVPEWEFDALRNYIATCEEMMIPLKIIDFYGNYKVKVINPICSRKMALHRNSSEIEFWGDGAHVRIKGQPFVWPEDEPRFTIHHFGSVRHPARLREKWHVQGRMYGKGRKIRIPGFVFNFLPYNWKDPDFVENLEVYEGPYIKAVRDNPNEFVRDNFQMYEFLKSRTKVANN